MRSASPLRYPGGKWRLAPFFGRLITRNFDSPPTYVEPYAGGASLALSLLLRKKTREAYLNDLDPAIHAFWRCVLDRPKSFTSLIDKTPVTPSEWRRQKEIYNAGTTAGTQALGFATFYLNRTNHSGILNAGMIGGIAQDSKWCIDARFNKPELVRRINLIAEHKDKIHLSCLDAEAFLARHRRGNNKLIYLDPPYYEAGPHLYFNSYRKSDHASLRDSIAKLMCPWVLSYDDVSAIRGLYRGYRSRKVELLHTAMVAREGKERMFFSPGLVCPRIK